MFGQFEKKPKKQQQQQSSPKMQRYRVGNASIIDKRISF
jgi:hypothetical protein